MGNVSDRVRPAHTPNWLAKDFSGGNQQKIVLGREIERKPGTCLLIGQPTRWRRHRCDRIHHEQIDRPA